MQVTRQGNIINVGERVRIESGPRRLTAVATAELLADDTTAGHYQEGKPDALGRPIALGEEMTYLDWPGQGRDGSTCYWLFELEDLSPEEAEASGLTQRWRDRDTFDNEEDALGAAFDLAVAAGS